MTINEKQSIATTARTLIRQLEFCDEEEFVDLVVNCIASADPCPIYPEAIR